MPSWTGKRCGCERTLEGLHSSIHSPTGACAERQGQSWAVEVHSRYNRPILPSQTYVLVRRGPQKARRISKTDAQQGGPAGGSKVWTEHAGHLDQTWAQTLVPPCTGCRPLSVYRPVGWGEQAEPRIHQCWMSGWGAQPHKLVRAQHWLTGGLVGPLRC